jgi:RNA exonuclease 4
MEKKKQPKAGAVSSLLASVGSNWKQLEQEKQEESKKRSEKSDEPRELSRAQKRRKRKQQTNPRGLKRARSESGAPAAPSKAAEKSEKAEAKSDDDDDDDDAGDDGSSSSEEGPDEKQPAPILFGEKRRVKRGQPLPLLKYQGTQLAAHEGSEKLIQNQTDARLTKTIALDCEMVGVGPDGAESMLAQVVIVNSSGDVVYNRYVRPREPVTDYRTRWSGIREPDLRSRHALSFETVQDDVAKLIEDRVLCGHGLVNDFKALLLSHPYHITRDTAKYRPLQRRRGKPQRLQKLAAQHLRIKIQTGEHDPAEDARASLLLYKHFKKHWDNALKKHGRRGWNNKTTVHKLE